METPAVTTLHDLRSMLATMRRKKDIAGPQALLIVGILDHIEALEQRGQSAIRPNFFDSGHPPAAAPPDQPTTNPCPICVTRREWAIGAKA